jgi:hypothetical protein
MTFCAAAGSDHNSVPSAWAFSSARRAFEASQSKMPPQQRYGPLDLIVQGVGLGRHFTVTGKS